MVKKERKSPRSKGPASSSAGEDTLAPSVDTGPVVVSTSLKVGLAASSRLMTACVSQVLSDLKMDLVTIENSSDVFGRVRSEQPLAILIQQDLEGLDINQISRLLKGMPETRHVAIIVLSTSAETEREALDGGADGFLEFPFNAERFSAVLASSRVHRKRILLVDDSKTIHEYIRTCLEGEPYDLMHAYDGRSGLDMLAACKPDLVITDLEMPHMTGYEVCAAIKNHPEFSRIPVIISSTLSQGFEIDKGFDVGADDYMVKPVDHDDLVNKLHSLFYSEIKRQRDRILVVDDSKVILSLLSNALESQGFRVSTAMRGDEGLRLAKSIKPALVITDCEMPGLNGRDLARELRTIPEYKHLPIVMLTAKEELVEKAKARKAGVSEFVSKPFTVDKILVIVERLIAEARMLREREAMMSYMSDAAIKHASGRAGSSSQTMTAYRDHAAVLFSDVCGFTSLSEKSTPEFIITLLNSYFDEMVQIIKNNHGTVDKFIGDAIMAIFYGKSPEINAFHAVQAGYQMIQKLGEINAAKTDESEMLHIRIGVNSGPVVFGDLGSRMSRRDFTVIGDNVNIAQRLESKAPKDHVLISDSAYMLVKDHVSIGQSETLALKGKAEGLLCHVLQTVHPKKTRQSA